MRIVRKKGSKNFRIPGLELTSLAVRNSIIEKPRIEGYLGHVRNHNKGSPMGFRPRMQSAHRCMAEFEALAKSAEPILYRVAFRLTGNYHDASDLIQDALVEAFRAFGSFKSGGRFDRWVLRIMTNNFIDRRRKKMGMPNFISLADLSRGLGEDDVQNELMDAHAGPEEQAVASEFHFFLRSAINRLPAEYSMAFVLCDMEELSYTEAAEIMGCPEGTVRSRLYRARHAIRRYLEPYVNQRERSPRDVAVEIAGD